MNDLNHIRTIVSQGQSASAIQVLWNNFNHHEFKDQVIALKARFSSLNDKIIGGVLTYQEISTEKNRIRSSLLLILNKIEASRAEKALENVNQKLDDRSLVKKLLEILNETYQGFLAQAKIRNQLHLTIKERLSLDHNRLEYEDFFEIYYSKMNTEELELHQTIRDYTEKIINVYNRKALELIIGNKQLKAAIPELHELERHLLVWLGKYEHLFKRKPSLSLVYLLLKEKVPFPRGIEAKLNAFLT